MDFKKKYFVFTKTIYENIDYKTFNKLYLPILGSDAFSLFLLLENSHFNKEFSYDYLKINLQLSASKIEKAFNVLEALNLIQSYENNNCYFHELQKPVSLFEFINDPILGSLLYNINADLYKENYDLIQDLQKISVGKNISKTFFEVFENTKIRNFQEIKNPKNTIMLEGNFNIDLFNKIYPNQTSKKTVGKIKKFALLYNFSEKDMLDLCVASLNELQEIDFDKLNYYVTKKYQNNTEISKIAPIRTTTDSNDLLAKRLVQLDKTSPIEFLKNKNGLKTPTKRDIDLVNKMIITYGLSSGVVNVILEYVLKNNNQVLTKNFIETLAGQMQRSNVNNAAEAFNILKKGNEKKVKKSYSKKSEVVPEWIDKEIEGVENDDELRKSFFEALEEK